MDVLPLGGTGCHGYRCGTACDFRHAYHYIGREDKNRTVGGDDPDSRVWNICAWNISQSVYDGHHEVPYGYASVCDDYVRGCIRDLRHRYSG